MKELTFLESQYQATMNEVAHATFDPYGPGVVRIHLIPPSPSAASAPSTVIINGQDILPINFSWAVLLNEFIKQVNLYSGHEVTDLELTSIVAQTLRAVRRVYPRTSKKRLRNDLHAIITTLCDVAHGKTPSTEIGYMPLGEYVPFMKAPHRIDLMVSAMTKNGAWHCNQKCLHCYAAGQQMAEVSELTTETWFAILDRCREIGIPQVTFTGGEPTMRDDIVELVDYAQWFVTRMNTNGAKLSLELCQRLYEASLDSIQITLYSADETIHNSLVGVKMYENTVNGIKNALTAGLSVSINTPLCTLNKDYVGLLAKLHEMGVRYVTCSGLIVTGNARNYDSRRTQLSGEELLEILRDAAQFCEEHHMEINFTSPGWLSEEDLRSVGLNVPTCGACLSNMAIAPNGEVVPCQSWLSKNASLGKILERPWTEIWESTTCTWIREASSAMLGLCPLRS